MMWMASAMRERPISSPAPATHHCPAAGRTYSRSFEFDWRAVHHLYRRFGMVLANSFFFSRAIAARGMLRTAAHWSKCRYGIFLRTLQSIGMMWMAWVMSDRPISSSVLGSLRSATCRATEKVNSPDQASGSSTRRMVSKVVRPLHHAVHHLYRRFGRVLANLFFSHARLLPGAC